MSVGMVVSMAKILIFFIKCNIISFVAAIAAILIYIAVKMIKKIIHKSSIISKVLIALICIVMIALAAGAAYAVIVYKINTEHKVILLFTAYIIQAIPWFYFKNYLWKRLDNKS